MRPEGKGRFAARRIRTSIFASSTPFNAAIPLETYSDQQMNQAG
jgi:hypothetical protein